MQRKLIQLPDADFKFDEAKGTFEGYASVFGGLDSYGDTILPGAYKDTLATRTSPVAMYFNHVSRRFDLPAKIGVWNDMHEDQKGLRVSGQLTKGHPIADAVLASMKSGALSGLSIGYTVPQGGSSKDGSVRKLSKINLFEVSAVDDPADASALIDRGSIKAAVDELKTLADAEDLLCEIGGFSKSAAGDFVSRMRTVILGEPGVGEKSDLPFIMASLQTLNLPRKGN